MAIFFLSIDLLRTYFDGLKLKFSCIEPIKIFDLPMEARGECY